MITQPAHAWVSGQVARHWGNVEFGTFAPFEETCLAAEQHDLGFLDWEAEPTLHRHNGLPHTFQDMPVESHLEIWSEGIHQMLRYNRYAAVLVSMHYSYICQQHATYRTPREAQMAQDFLDEQRTFQAMWRRLLADDPHYGRYSTEAVLQRNRQLVSAWDYLSLLLCMGLEEPRRVAEVPTANGCVELLVSPVQKEPQRALVTPWPFAQKQVTLVCEGRLLTGKYTNEARMRADLTVAQPLSIVLELVPG